MRFRLILAPLLLMCCVAAAQDSASEAAEKAAAEAAEAEVTKQAAEDMQHQVEERFLQLQRNIYDQNEIVLRRMEHVEERVDSSQRHLDRLVLILALSMLVIFMFINNNLRTRIRGAEGRVRQATENAANLMNDIQREISRPELQHLHISQILRRLMRQLRDRDKAVFSSAHIDEVRTASNDPYLPVSLYLIARILVAEHDNNWNIAVQMLEQLREMDSKDPDVLLHLSHVHKNIASTSVDRKLRTLHQRLSYQYYAQFNAAIQAEELSMGLQPTVAPRPAAVPDSPDAPEIPMDTTPLKPAPVPMPAAVPPPPEPKPTPAPALPPPHFAPPAAPAEAPPPAAKPTADPSIPAQIAAAARAAAAAKEKAGSDTPAPATAPTTPPPTPAPTPATPAAPATTPPAAAADKSAAADTAAKPAKTSLADKITSPFSKKSAAPAAAASPAPAANGKEKPPTADTPADKKSPFASWSFSSKQASDTLRKAGGKVGSLAKNSSGALSRFISVKDDAPLPFLPVPSISEIPKDVPANKMKMWQEIQRGDMTMAKATEAKTLRERNRLIDDAIVYYAQGQAHSTNEVLYYNWGMALLAKALHVPEKKRAPFFNASVDKFLAGNVSAPHYFDFHLAALHAIIGNKDECRKWLETSRQHGGLDGESLRQAPDFDSVRHEPWFDAFLQ